MTTETTAKGQSRQLVSTIPPAPITNMTPRPSPSTPQNRVPPGFDEMVTRRSWDALALIYWLSAGRAQRLKPAWNEPPCTSNRRATLPSRGRPSATSPRNTARSVRSSQQSIRSSAKAGIATARTAPPLTMFHQCTGSRPISWKKSPILSGSQATGIRTSFPPPLIRRNACPSRSRDTDASVA
jgi:hypothetical protein